MSNRLAFALEGLSEHVHCIKRNLSGLLIQTSVFLYALIIK